MTKQILFITCAFCCLSVGSGELPAGEVLDAAHAISRAGEKATIRYKVEGGTFLDREQPICFLNSHKNYMADDNFTVVIFSEGLARFRKAGVPNPLEKYKGKTIQVSGVVGLRQGKPQIIVEYVGQIEEVEQRNE